MISVVIPTLNSEHALVPTLSALVPAAMSGVVREVVIADGGSTDKTAAIAEDAGAKWVACPSANRGAQLRLGAAAATAPWLLFLHADTQLEAGWEQPTSKFMYDVDQGVEIARAGIFEFRLDDQRWQARLVEKAVAARTKVLKFPYGDQGLLMSRQFYNELGGYRAIGLMEDVDLIRRIGRKGLRVLPVQALTSADRYQRDGYLQRILRNQLCLALYYLNVSPDKLVRLYYGAAKDGSQVHAKPDRQANAHRA